MLLQKLKSQIEDIKNNFKKSLATSVCSSNILRKCKNVKIRDNKKMFEKNNNANLQNTSFQQDARQISQETADMHGIP